MRRPNIDDTVSLFSFLDIMACLIGILVLMIVIVTLAQLSQDQPDKSDPKEVAEAQMRKVKYRQADKAVKQDRREQERLERLVQESEAVQQQLASLNAEVAKLEAQRQQRLQQQTAHNSQAQTLRTEAEKLQETLPPLEAQLKQRQEQQAQLRAQLAELKKPPPEPEVQILPSGSGYDLHPTFVECAAGSVVLYDGPEPKRIPRGEVATHPAFRQLMEKVKQDKKGTLVFLVRPDGVTTYNQARNVARANYVKNGKLAVAGQGKLDLSLFQKSGAGAKP